jgi:hypothetical protein
MKKKFLLLAFVLAALPALLVASDSKRTADYLLTTPSDFEGKEVTLDVAMVKPMNLKSPNDEIALFHAATIDRQDYRGGGDILVVVLASEAANFAKKYGTDFQGRNHMTTLRGTFIASPRGPRGQVWMVDTTGKAAELIKQNKLILDGEGGPGPRGPGPGPGPGPRHPGWR